MKLAFLTLTLLFGLAACSPLQEPTPSPFLGNSVSDLPYRIRTRSYPAIKKGIPYQATATYRYDSLNRLTRIDSAWSDRSFLYRYDNNRLVERLTVSVTTNDVFFRETFEYDSSGRLLRSLWTGNGAASENKYGYNKDGMIAEIQTNALTYTYKRLSAYYWQNGNIVAITYWNDKGEKQSEWSYQYDNQPNISALLSTSPNPDDAFSMNRNNIVVSTLERDYTGLIDLIVNPVRYTFTYDVNGLPVRRLVNYNERPEEFAYERKQ